MQWGVFRHYATFQDFLPKSSSVLAETKPFASIEGHIGYFRPYETYRRAKNVLNCFEKFFGLLRFFGFLSEAQGIRFLWFFFWSCGTDELFSSMVKMT